MLWLSSASRLACAPLVGRAGPGRLAGVQIVAADLAEKNLAFHAKAAAGGGGVAGGNQARDHLKLRTQRRIERRASAGRP